MPEPFPPEGAYGSWLSFIHTFFLIIIVKNKNAVSQSPLNFLFFYPTWYSFTQNRRIKNSRSTSSKKWRVWYIYLSTFESWEVSLLDIDLVLELNLLMSPFSPIGCCQLHLDVCPDPGPQQPINHQGGPEEGLDPAPSGRLDVYPGRWPPESQGDTEEEGAREGCLSRSSSQATGELVSVFERQFRHGNWLSSLFSPTGHHQEESCSGQEEACTHDWLVEVSTAFRSLVLMVLLSWPHV